MKIKPPLEKDIQKVILQWLSLKKIFHYKQNTTGIFKKSTQSYIPSQSTGAPDIVIVAHGKYIGIEVKRRGAKQSESQIAFQKNLEKAGGEYILAYELEDVIKVLR